MIRNINGVNEIALINIFASINGEGYASGKPTVFIRTMGCNLRCGFCDTKESWTKECFIKIYPDRDEYMWRNAQEIFNTVESIEEGWYHKSICLTGGEPLMEDNKDFMIKELLPLFIKANYQIDIETDGGVDYSDYKKVFGPAVTIGPDNMRYGVTFIADYKLPYSGMNDKMIKSNFELYDSCDLVKMVISDDPRDWEELNWVINDSQTKAAIYLSPCFGKVTLNKIPEYIMAHADKNIRAQIQAHKVFWPIDKKDV